MWNRVFLLTAGVATGWTLVHLWTAPTSEATIHRYRLVLALVCGLGLVTFLGVSSLQAGLAGLFVFVFSALVAYAANARQVSKAPEPALLRRPSPPDRSDRRVAVLLAVDGEPPRYDGPQYWAQAYRLQQAHGKPAPHWFVRPLVYSRIRAAYAAMGGQHPLEAALIQASAALQKHMGAGYVVRHAYLMGHPQLTRSLVSLADEGFRHICLVCLASLTSEEAGLHQAVSDSRVREFGIRVTYASAPGVLLGAEDLYSDHLLALARGHPLASAPEVAGSQIESISACVLQSMDRESRPRGNPSKDLG